MPKINIESLNPSCILEIVKYYEKETKDEDSFFNVLAMKKIELDILSTECLVNIILNKSIVSAKYPQPNLEWNYTIKNLVRYDLINIFFNIITETMIKRNLLELLGEKYTEEIFSIKSNSIRNLGKKIGNKELGKIISEKYINQQKEILTLVGDNGGRNLLYKIIQLKHP
jgi:hypothetical protein